MTGQHWVNESWYVLCGHMKEINIELRASANKKALQYMAELMTSLNISPLQSWVTWLIEITVYLFIEEVNLQIRSLVTYSVWPNLWHPLYFDIADGRMDESLALFSSTVKAW